ncbi:hypothetical protein GIB67_001883 [Kingdonia uniflora]|uniref:Uncharacterized protein n=1 Tax=Kingdonia uniflora TaxID=39325 RepID=A0A7J7LQQ3_9MAGN|nr:hypothetical protein GIB67_001883 [Kingdonia uniflora]
MGVLKFELLDRDVLGKLAASISSQFMEVNTTIKMMSVLSLRYELMASSNLISRKQDKPYNVIHGTQDKPCWLPYCIYKKSRLGLDALLEISSDSTVSAIDIEFLKALDLGILVEITWTKKKNEDGGWGFQIAGHSTMFGTILNYICIRLLGLGPEGGCNPMPPKFWLLPFFMPMHSAKMRGYCRMVYVPMSYLCRKRFFDHLTDVILSLRKELHIEPYNEKAVVQILLCLRKASIGDDYKVALQGEVKGKWELDMDDD